MGNVLTSDSFLLEHVSARLNHSSSPLIPAKAGIQGRELRRLLPWIPARAGMSGTCSRTSLRGFQTLGGRQDSAAPLGSGSGSRWIVDKIVAVVFFVVDLSPYGLHPGVD